MYSSENIEKEFKSIEELIDYVIVNGVDPNYYITFNNESTEEKVIELIQF